MQNRKGMFVVEILLCCGSWWVRREVGAPATKGPFRAPSTNPGGGRRLLVIKIPFVCVCVLELLQRAGVWECSLWHVCG